MNRCKHGNRRRSLCVFSRHIVHSAVVLTAVILAEPAYCNTFGHPIESHVLAQFLGWSPVLLLQSLQGRDPDVESPFQREQRGTGAPDSTSAPRTDFFLQYLFPDEFHADISWTIAEDDSIKKKKKKPNPLEGNPLDQSLKQPVKDTTVVEPPADSTARVKWLTFRPKDSPVAPLFGRQTHPLFLTPSRGPKWVVEVDSVRDMVRIREMYNGKDVRIPIVLPLDEYIRLRYEYERERRTREYAHRYQPKKTGDDLGEIIKSLSEIDIPIPPNPLMSIFGERSRISLRISGAVNITGGFRSESSDQQTVYRNPTQNSPIFKQQVQINVQGTIGDKLFIGADWATDRTFNYENTMKIEYKGYEDEIVQHVELGNVTLSIPATLVAGSGSLFGVKADFKFGPLKLQTLWSEKKAQSSSLSISGGAKEEQFERHAYQYSTTHYFVDTVYRGVYEDYYNQPNHYPIVHENLYIKDIEVWTTRTASASAIDDPEERDAIVLIDVEGRFPGDPYPAAWQDYFDPNKTIPPKSGFVETGKFKLLVKDQDYTYNPYTGIISLSQNLMDDQILAVSYRIRGASTDASTDIVYGVFVNDPNLPTGYTDEDGNPIPPRLVLKLVKPKNLSPSFRPAWDQQVRSIYSIGQRNLTEEQLKEVRLIYRAGGQQDDEFIEGINLLQLFGLDYNDGAGGSSDSKIDWAPGYTVDPIRGELIFPTLEPFGEGLVQFMKSKGVPEDVARKYTYPDIYTRTVAQARQNTARDKILIVGTTRGTSGATYNLGFNLVPGSVRVYLDGRLLTPNVDYRVDEFAGQVTITNEAALVDGANLDIQYETQDLFSFASKTMLGLRGDLELGEKTMLGFTVLNLNQQSLSDKVRIGEEPINNTMLGLDGRAEFNVDFLTNALNKMPFYASNDPSTFKLQGELAYMVPDPNTKKSTISSDGGQGIAYIDDFEGAKIFIPLQTSYSAWDLSSPPVYNPFRPSLTDSVALMHNYRAKMWWYNLPYNSSQAVSVNEIWPNKRVAREDQRINILEIEYDPERRGMFNYTPDLKSFPRGNWAGIMRLLPVNAYNLVQDNYSFIEIWMKAENVPPGAQMRIDLGKISEDVIPNGKLNSEDYVLGPTRNGIVNPGEDVGLDMLTNDEELALYANEIAQYGTDYPDMVTDPSGDNYNYDPTDFEQIDGTEGNENDLGGLLPDTEDMNYNGSLDLTNEYFEYVVDPNIDPLNPSSNPYYAGGGNNGWYQFRIPLANPDTVIGSPSLDNVEFLRIWVTGSDQPLRLRIADFTIVGNQWIERKRNDPYFNVSVVNIEDNPEYTSPPGVIRARDRLHPDQNVLANEQSLALIFNNLPEDTTRMAFRYFPNGIDLFNYRVLKMFVHGDDPLNYDVDFILRIGVDTANYYEYKAPVKPGWHPFNEVNIEFSRLSAIKQFRDSTLVDSLTWEYGTSFFPYPGGAPGDSIRVVGNPDLVRVMFISVGVHNPRGKNLGSISGHVWVNELRVTAVDDRNGLAFAASANLQMADFMNVNFQISHTDPFFHRLEERAGSRSNSLNFSASTSIKTEKMLLPPTWQSSQLQVNYTHAERIITPTLLPGQPDVEVETAVDALRAKLETEKDSTGITDAEIEKRASDLRFQSQTVEIKDTWAMPSLRFRGPEDSWFNRYIINRMEMGYNYSIVRYRDPVIMKRRRWNWMARIGYSIDIPPLDLRPFETLFHEMPVLNFWEAFVFNPLPKRISLNAQLSRSRTEERTYSLNGGFRPYQRAFIHTRGFSTSFQPFQGGLLNPSLDYTASFQSTLLKIETLRDYEGNELAQRQSSVIMRDIFFGKTGGFYFGDATGYDQRLAFNTRPTIPPVLGLDKVMDINLSYNVNYRWQKDLQQGVVGTVAAYNASTQASINFKLKQWVEPLFPSEKESAATSVKPRSRIVARPIKPKKTKTARNPLEAGLDSTALATDSLATDSLAAKADSLQPEGGGFSINPGKILAGAAKWLIKAPFLDYDNIQFQFQQSTNSQVGGVVGETGFLQFWTSPPLFGNPGDPSRGPSQLYQLGLISDPNPLSGRIAFKSSFPFIGIENYRRGYRIPSGRGITAQFIDDFRQNNTVSIRTQRKLWEGAKLDLTWDMGWDINKNYQISTDSLGRQSINTVTITGNSRRSFMSMPDWIFFSAFGTNIEAVNRKYETLKAENPGANESELLAEAFEQGLEVVPFFSDLAGIPLPRLNWAFKWDGLEKLPIFEDLVKRLSIEHRYTSTIETRIRNNQDGGIITESKRVTQNFQPFLGVSMSFQKLWKGDLSLTTRWGKQNTIELNTSSNNIVQTSTNEFTASLSYRKTGFEVPMLGLRLKNDLEVTVSFSRQNNSQLIFDIKELDKGGTPREGTTRTTLEPRIRYVLSRRVTGSLFYRYQRTSPDDLAGSRIPGTTIHEGGLEIRLTISGS